MKLGIPYDEVWSFPKQYFTGLEINDGYLKTPPGMDMVTETTQHRQLCGNGEFDIKGFLAKLPGSNYSGPVGIEVLNKEMRSWPLEKTANTAFQTTLAQFPSGAPQVNTQATSSPNRRSEAPRRWHERMLLIRRMEEKLSADSAAGILPGAVHLYIGQEAVAAGVCMQLKDSDWITSTHRGHGHFLGKGGDPQGDDG